MAVNDDLNVVGSYLAQRDVKHLGPNIADWIVLMGSSLLGPISAAAEAFFCGVAPRVLVVGGIGHSTQGLRDAVLQKPDLSGNAVLDRSEAEIINDILIDHFDVPQDVIALETLSTNCGANAIEARRTLDRIGETPRRLLLIQDPTMQRRTHASFVRAWADRPEVELISYAPFIPTVNQGLVVGGDRYPVWPLDRYVSLLVGEIDRLRDDEQGYGPNGQNFIDHVDLPSEVEEAAHRIIAVVPASRR